MPNWGFNTEITAGPGGFSTPAATTACPMLDKIDFTMTATKVQVPAGIPLDLVLIGMGGMRRRKRA